MKVDIVCRNWRQDRVLPRFARHLSEHNEWALTETAQGGFDLIYYVAYFELQKNHGFTEPAAAYFTHSEPGEKDRVYHNVARAMQVRVAMNAGQLPDLLQYGPTIKPPLPLETVRFKPAGRKHTGTPVIGFSGWVYKSGRKGDGLAAALTKDFTDVRFTASGSGWPCETKFYEWDMMPRFYNSLDMYVSTATIEGGPMTTLEALACGVPVVIPDTVGIHPELPDVHGIYRYHTGDYASLKAAVAQALEERGTTDPAALRDATQPHSVAAFCEATRQGLEGALYEKPEYPVIDNWRNHCGIYVVAFGDPAREQARRCISSAHKFMPDVPVALCSDKPLGPETIFIKQPDSDIGGRIAKLKVYELAPKKWDYVLYVDADTEFIADVSFYFQLVADGWEFVICKDAHLHDTLKHFERGNNTAEFNQTVAQVGTEHTLAINGGVWAFRRCPRVAAFFKRWFTEWAQFKGRDQGALLRALYADPLKVYWLGNEWNTLITLKGQEYPPGKAGSAGILHHVGKARRWEGQVPAGKGLTDPEAWAMVDAFEKKRKAKAVKKAKK